MIHQCHHLCYIVMLITSVFILKLQVFPLTLDIKMQTWFYMVIKYWVELWAWIISIKVPILAMIASSCWVEQRKRKSVCLFVVDFLSFFEEHIKIQNAAEKTPN